MCVTTETRLYRKLNISLELSNISHSTVVLCI